MILCLLKIIVKFHITEPRFLQRKFKQQCLQLHKFSKMKNYTSHHQSFNTNKTTTYADNSGPVLEQLHKCLALYWSSDTNVWPCIGAVTQMSGPVLEQ